MTKVSNLNFMFENSQKAGRAKWSQGHMICVFETPIIYQTHFVNLRKKRIEMQDSQEKLASLNLTRKQYVDQTTNEISLRENATGTLELDCYQRLDRFT